MEQIVACRSTPSGSARSQVSIVYVAGYGRSGSTLIGQLLGELPGAVYLGELNFFWSDTVLGDRPCGCGCAAGDCPVWARVMKRLGPDLPIRAGEVVELLARTTRTRHGLAQLTSMGRRRLAVRTAVLARHLEVLYRAIADETGCEVIVDSSKSPMYRAVLEAVPGLRIDTVQVVRDPRGVADSWRRPKREPIGSAELPTFGPAHSAVLWLVVNLLARRRDRRRGERPVLVRYEDVMVDPRAALAAVGAGLGRDTGGLEIAEDRRVALGVSHSVAGNPRRFATGPVELRSDEAWRERLGARHRLIVTLLTLPALRRFGYRVRG